MKKVLNILKECDIRNILFYLTEGLPEKKYEKMLVRYYSLYCMLSELWIPYSMRETIIIGFRQSGRECGNPVYSFFGISTNSSGTRTSPEEPVEWEAFLKGEAEFLVPACVMEVIDGEQMAAEIFLQMEKVCPKDISVKKNEKLFDSFRKYSQCGKNRLSAIAKVMEKAFCYELDRRLVRNEIWEYMENKCIVVKWGDILENWEEPVPERIMEQLKKSNLLVRQSFSRQMASGSNDNVYSKFARLDPENTPDVCRCYSAIKDIRSRYREIGLSDYQYVTEEHMRIIIEHNPSAADLPIIYIRDKFGEKTEFSGSEPELSRLLCMDICMTDEKYKNPDRILALIAFYREYPIRVKRIQQEALLLKFTRILYICGHSFGDHAEE
ncbi:MAG TPA: hypothetical protein H9775_10965 [Candidatus Blautia merdipullorum]|nr:hypothetical protein [Candidatus Blautia merdipullorum]